MYAKFRCAALRIKKALGIFRELITTTTTTTRVAFGDPPSESKNEFEMYIKAARWRITSARLRLSNSHVTDATRVFLSGSTATFCGHILGLAEISFVLYSVKLPPGVIAIRRQKLFQQNFSD